MQLYAELQHIDYDKLLSHIRGAYKNTHKRQDFFSSLFSGFTNGLKQFFGKLVINPWILKKITENPSFLKSPAAKLSQKYGVLFTVLKIESDTLISKKTGEKNMLNISATIGDIDYDRLARRITESKDRKDGVGNERIYEAVRIVKPFIDKTMATIPPSAIAELFELFARDKIIKLAGEAGVTISNVSVKPG